MPPLTVAVADPLFAPQAALTPVMLTLKFVEAATVTVAVAVQPLASFTTTV